MRKSQEGIVGIKKDNYFGLPDVLKEFNYYYQDSGHVIMAIPESLLKDATENGDLDMFECPVPCKYVLEQGFRIFQNHVVVDCTYDEFVGLVVDDSYYEYTEFSAQSEIVMVKTEIGEKFFLSINQEGLFFDTDKMGANLIVGFYSPTQKEIAQFSTATDMRFGLSVIDNILFILAKIGDLNWMDAPYNPSFASSLKPLDFELTDENGMRMWVYLVDVRTNILKAQRLIVLGRKFSRDFQHIAKGIVQKSGQVSDFNYRLQNVYKKYSTNNLVDLANSYYKVEDK